MTFIQRALKAIDSKDDKSCVALWGKTGVYGYRSVRVGLQYLNTLRSQGYITIDKKADLVLITDKGKREII